MAFKKGVAANFNDLLTQFLAFVTTDPALVADNQQYEVLFDRTTTFTGQQSYMPNRRHVALRSRGLAGADQIYSCISTDVDTAADFFNLAICGGTAWLPDNLVPGYPDLRTGLASPSKNMYLQCWDQETPYWFFATGRRWFIVVKISATYGCGGAGFILPPCPPAEYRYPMAIWGGTSIARLRWANVSDQHEGAMCGVSQMRNPSGEWVTITGNSSSSAQDAAQFHAKLPTGAGLLGEIGGQPELAILNSIRDNPDGSFSLWPITFMRYTRQAVSSIPVGTTFGEADGMMWIPSLNNGAEDEVVVDGVSYIVFPSINRANSPYLFVMRAT